VDALALADNPAPSVCSADVDPTAAVLSSPDRQGVSIQLQLRLSWQGSTLQPPQLSADVVLGPASLVLCPHHLPMLLSAHEWAQRLAQRAAEARAADTSLEVQATGLGPGVTIDGWADLAVGGDEGHWGRCAAGRRPLAAGPALACWRRRRRHRLTPPA
jgi:hypothetical protein